MSPIKQSAFGASVEPTKEDHENYEGFVCGLCDRVFDTRRGLSRHQTMSHKGETIPPAGEAPAVASSKIPNDDDAVSVVFSATGQATKRLWVEAVELRRLGEIVLSADLESAYQSITSRESTKMDQEDLEFDGVEIPADDEDIPLEVEGAKVTWSWAQVVTHVIDNGNSNVKIAPVYKTALDQLRSERSSGSANGGTHAIEASKRGPVTPIKRVEPAPSGEVAIGPSGLPMLKVTMGFKEHVGLPDYSGLDIGPASLSVFVEDNGESLELERSDTKDKVIVNKAAYEAMRTVSQTVEMVMRAERQAMINFLESVK